MPNTTALHSNSQEPSLLDLPHALSEDDPPSIIETHSSNPQKPLHPSISTTTDNTSHCDTCSYDSQATESSSAFREKWIYHFSSTTTWEEFSLLITKFTEGIISIAIPNNTTRKAPKPPNRPSAKSKHQQKITYIRSNQSTQTANHV